MDSTVEELGIGSVETFRRNGLEIRVYDCRDEAGARVIMVVRDGKCILIEQPGFRKNIDELSKYILDSGL
ncbi:MAG: hypothetical protein IJ856_02055 [Candidatus Methanomethylophilaceae archaeon]|nr:hypothetical protein [Candidatus Methanomethylophilaceae archaeon]